MNYKKVASFDNFIYANMALGLLQELIARLQYLPGRRRLNRAAKRIRLAGPFKILQGDHPVNKI